MKADDRKAIAITSNTMPATGGYEPCWTLTVLCNDGTMWSRNNDGEWYQIPNVPQPEVSDDNQ